jgi:hypothetical protein
VSRELGRTGLKVRGGAKTSKSPAQLHINRSLFYHFLHVKMLLSATQKLWTLLQKLCMIVNTSRFRTVNMWKKAGGNERITDVFEGSYFKKKE